MAGPDRERGSTESRSDEGVALVGVRGAVGGHDRVMGWMLGPMFGALAVGMLVMEREMDGAPVDVEPASVSREALATGGRRVPTVAPVARVGGFAYGCNECHRLFESPVIQHRAMVQHRHVALRHGMNDNCFNCHDRHDRERLVLRTGERIEFGEGGRLCAPCHGTVWRDWERGAHGKTLGSWEESRMTRLQCVECHDPHAPAYPAVEPLPGPRTPRMGEPRARVEHRGGSPLRRGGAGRSDEPRGAKP